MRAFFFHVCSVFVLLTSERCYSVADTEKRNVEASTRSKRLRRRHGLLSSSSKLKAENAGTREFQHAAFDESSFPAEDLEYLLRVDMSMPPSSPSCTTPAPFNDDSERQRIHLVMNNQNAAGDMERQAEGIQNAIEGGASSIITVGGDGDSLCDFIEEAILIHSIPVVSFDFHGEKCAEDHLLISQSDDAIARMVLEEAAAKYSGDGPKKVGYVTDLSYPSLQTRDAVWEEFKASNGWEEVFRISNAGVYGSEFELYDAILRGLLEAVLDGSSGADSTNLSFIYSPWEYAALQAVAVSQSRDSIVDVWGAGISDLGIAAMTDPPSSPWKATAGSAPTMIGAAVLRMSLLQIAEASDIQGVESIDIPTFLLAQDSLLESGVGSMEELFQLHPEMMLEDIAPACWIESPTN